jgi:hypothetical protein
MWGGVNFIMQTIFRSLFNLTGIIGGWVFRKHQTLYLDVCVLAQKKENN